MARINRIRTTIPMMTPVDTPLALQLPSSSIPSPEQQSAPSLVADTSPSAMQAVGPDDVGAAEGPIVLDGEREYCDCTAESGELLILSSGSSIADGAVFVVESGEPLMDEVGAAIVEIGEPLTNARGGVAAGGALHPGESQKT